MVENTREYQNFVSEFCNLLYSIKERYTDIVFLGIGTDRITGDSYGPLVGKKLTELFQNCGLAGTVSVVGTLESPVPYTSIESTVSRIKQLYSNPCIIAIDSAVGREQDVGKVLVTLGSMCFGTGIQKRMIEVGDISIKGVVTKNTQDPRNNLECLQNTPLNRVMQMADFTSSGIYDVIRYL